jgi:hypothetical protein
MIEPAALGIDIHRHGLLLVEDPPDDGVFARD